MVITLLATLGVTRMILMFRANSVDFKNSGKFLRAGIFLGVILWFTFFLSVGGEWFLMWQSKIWNGQSTAFMLTICFLLFLIYLSQPDDQQV